MGFCLVEKKVLLDISVVSDSRVGLRLVREELRLLNGNVGRVWLGDRKT